VALRPDHTIFEWNRPAELLFGVTRDDALGTSYIDRFLPKEQREAVAADIVKVLEGTPTTVEQFEELANPDNCAIVVLERGENEKYRLVTVIERRDVKHPWTLP